MTKLLLLGLTVIGCAMPAAAGANEMRDSSGKVALGSGIKFESHNTVVTNTALGNLQCKTIVFTWKVNVNGPIVVTGTGTAGETATCEAGGNLLTITKPTLVHLETTGGDTVWITLSFRADVGPFECQYVDKVPGSFLTGAGNDTMTFNGIIFSTSEICEPEELFPVFHGSYTMTTTATGQPVFIQ